MPFVILCLVVCCYEPIPSEKASSIPGAFWEYTRVSQKQTLEWHEC